MLVQDIAKLGRLLSQFLDHFVDCFARPAGRQLLAVYVRGLLSDVQRKNVEAMALAQDVAPRTLQRFIESIAWDEQLLRDRCQRLIAAEHAHPDAIGCIDETGIAKSGKHTAGAKRQYNGNRGKIENCVNNVALSYAAPGFSCLLDARLYLPEEWATDPVRRKQNYIPDEVVFRTKPQIALELIDRARRNGIQVLAWTADELYGRDSAFLDGLDQRRQTFVVEIPPNARVWIVKPRLQKKCSRKARGPSRKCPQRLGYDRKTNQVRHLAKWSPAFREQNPQRYRIKETHHGAEVWEIRWHTCWRKASDGRPVAKQCISLVARNLLTQEIKYFLANQVPGRDGWSLRQILRVAFGRWPIEDCFREAKEELSLDHFECRGWRCIHRHLYVTILSHLFCARVRQRLSPSEEVTSGELLTVEQVRRAVNTFLEARVFPASRRQQHYQEEADQQEYYARRNATASRSHRKTRRQQLADLGIDADRIKSVPPKRPPG